MRILRSVGACSSSTPLFLPLAELPAAEQPVGVVLDRLAVERLHRRDDDLRRRSSLQRRELLPQRLARRRVEHAGVVDDAPESAGYSDVAGTVTSPVCGDAARRRAGRAARTAISSFGALHHAAGKIAGVEARHHRLCRERPRSTASLRIGFNALSNWIDRASFVRRDDQQRAIVALRPIAQACAAIAVVVDRGAFARLQRHQDDLVAVLASTAASLSVIVWRPRREYRRHRQRARELREVNPPTRCDDSSERDRRSGLPQITHLFGQAPLELHVRRWRVSSATVNVSIGLWLR